jgi:hypothetical protein
MNNFLVPCFNYFFLISLMSDIKYRTKYFQMSSNQSSRPPSGASALHSLHSQISNAVIDYSPWMRQRRIPKSAGTGTTVTFGGLPRRLWYSVFKSN